jgi:inosine-uridine nucleoside N-ribohydrolase
MVTFGICLVRGLCVSQHILKLLICNNVLKKHFVDVLTLYTKYVLIIGEIKLVAMAPLTNLGVALRMDPEFSRRLQSLVIMGGNTQGTFQP